MRQLLIGAVVFVGVIGGIVWFFIWVDAKQERGRRELREGPCSDQSTLLATTSGSPSSFTCPNKLHEMQVQVATHPSSEEAAALVFCKCGRVP